MIPLDDLSVRNMRVFYPCHQKGDTLLSGPVIYIIIMGVCTEMLRVHIYINIFRLFIVFLYGWILPVLLISGFKPVRVLFCCVESI